MERTQIYMTEKQKKELAALAAETGESQSVLIRKALDSYLAREGKDRIDAQKDFWTSYAGTWDATEDSVDYVERLRAGADSRLNRLHGQLAESAQGGYRDMNAIIADVRKADKKNKKPRKGDARSRWPKKNDKKGAR